mmetsp:Transcript_36518/g.57313  ORF Transcript_36518/g.57313 Transcript_36518/m.57313 type:complete len:108 (+) Transcript_36518:1295-1618(+)
MPHKHLSLKKKKDPMEDPMKDLRVSSSILVPNSKQLFIIVFHNASNHSQTLNPPPQKNRSGEEPLQFSTLHHKTDTKFPSLFFTLPKINPSPKYSSLTLPFGKKWKK